jgi:hypothetical protein
MASPISESILMYAKYLTSVALQLGVCIRPLEKSFPCVLLLCPSRFLPQPMHSLGWLKATSPPQGLEGSCPVGRVSF